MHRLRWPDSTNSVSENPGTVQTGQHEAGADAQSQCIVQKRERTPRERHPVIALRFDARARDHPRAHPYDNSLRRATGR